MRTQPYSATAEIEPFLQRFRHLFRRSDQAAHFGNYLRGLRAPIARKNIESISSFAAHTEESSGDLAQALQHFVSQSPWNVDRLTAAIRRESASLRDDSESVWVLHDVAFAKKGAHSVGVQRQFARALGRKINCQLAVFVSQVGHRGFFPLAFRLYLPSRWLREHGDLAEKTIPAPHARPASKCDLAFELFDELLREGEAPKRISSDVGYSSLDVFSEGLASRGLEAEENPERSLSEAERGLDELRCRLGLDHFEGRTWQGWHRHVGLVITAYYSSLRLGG